MHRLKSFFSALAALLLALAALPASAALLASDKAVLEAIYIGTNGASWTNSDNWMSGDPCANNWYGVACNGAGTRVTDIELYQNNLTGTLPATLAGLTELEYFSVSQNQLTGSLPHIEGLTKLWFFSARNNQLTGTLPSFAGLISLERFYVQDNQLTGTLPSFAGLISLQRFDVEDNQLTGSIPVSVSWLTELRSFRVGGNQLTGKLPSAPQKLEAGASSLCPNFVHFPASGWNNAVGLYGNVNCTPGWLVTVDVGANGSSDKSSHPVVEGEATAITLIPDAGYRASVAGTCGGLLSDGGVYTTEPVTQDCTVEVSFTRQDGPHPGDRVTAVPTLGEWALLLLATLLGALGLRHARTRGR